MPTAAWTVFRLNSFLSWQFMHRPGVFAARSFGFADEWGLWHDVHPMPRAAWTVFFPKGPLSWQEKQSSGWPAARPRGAVPLKVWGTPVTVTPVWQDSQPICTAACTEAPLVRREWHVAQLMDCAGAAVKFAAVSSAARTGRRNILNKPAAPAMQRE